MDTDSSVEMRSNVKSLNFIPCDNFELCWSLDMRWKGNGGGGGCGGGHNFVNIMQILEQRTLHGPQMQS